MNDIFSEVMKLPNTLSVENYKLKENEKITDDGEYIVCTKCGTLKRRRQFIEVFDEECWWPIERNVAGLCPCEVSATLAKSAEEEQKHFMMVYDCDFLKSLLGSAYAGKHFEELPPTNNISYNYALGVCQNFVKNINISLQKGYGFYLYSKSAGTGKTTLMACVRNALLEKGVLCAFINEKDFINFCRDKSKKYDSNGWFGYSFFLTADVLILDDVGASNLSGDNGYTNWRNENLYELIEERNRNNKCTLFTSNYGPDELGKRGIDFKTVDRILERSKRVVELDGGSFRGNYVGNQM